MKIEKFLNWIQEKLINYPDISIKTVKIFIDGFYNHLSNKEQERYWITLQIIKEFTSKQLSLDTIVQNVIVNNLEVELNNLKNDKNENNKIR